MVWKFAAGYPPHWLPKYIKAGERLIEWFCQYVEKPFEASELATLTVQYSQEGGLGKRDVGAILNSTLWPVMANAPWAA